MLEEEKRIQEETDPLTVCLGFFSNTFHLF